MRTPAVPHWVGVRPNTARGPRGTVSASRCLSQTSVIDHPRRLHSSPTLSQDQPRMRRTIGAASTTTSSSSTIPAVKLARASVALQQRQLDRDLATVPLDEALKVGRDIPAEAVLQLLRDLLEGVPRPALADGRRPPFSGTMA